MAEAQKKSNEKQPKNIVHEQAILVETIKKELREQKLYKNFSINPFVKRKNNANKTIGEYSLLINCVLL